MKALDLHVRVDDDTTALTLTSIVSSLQEKYRSLKAQNLWTPQVIGKKSKTKNLAPYTSPSTNSPPRLVPTAMGRTAEDDLKTIEEQSHASVTTMERTDISLVTAKKIRKKMGL